MFLVRADVMKLHVFCYGHTFAYEQQWYLALLSDIASFDDLT